MAPSFSPSESKVQDLVNRYRKVHELHPLLADMFSSTEFEGIFHDALKHEQYIICRRSQDLADNEITFMQKAFAELLKDSAWYYAATALWVEEILGINVVPVENKPTVLNEMVKAKSLTLDRLQECQNGSSRAGNEPLSTDNESLPTTDGRYRSTRKHAEVTNSDENIYENGQQPYSHDAKFLRLMEVYKKARSEFDTTPPKSLDRTKAAKFLRDTIENCQTYIGSKHDVSQVNGSVSNTLHADVPLDVATVAEMERFLKKASVIAEKGSGGKKRRFEKEHDDETPSAVSYPEQSGVTTMSASAFSNLVENQGETSLGRYSVTRQSEHPHPPMDYLRERRELDQFNGYFDSPLRQRGCGRPAMLTYRGRAPSPHPQARHKGFRQLSGGETRFGPMAYHNCYRPSYH